MVVRSLQGVDDASALEEETRRVCHAVPPRALVDVTKAAVGLLSQDVAAEDLGDVFEQLAAKHAPLEVKVIRAAFRTFVLLVQGALRNNVSPDQLAADMTELGCEEAVAGAIGKVWRDKLVNVSRNVLGNTVTVNQLVDIQWRFGVTASSNELSDVGATFLQLNLELESGDDVHMEMSLPQFYQFLHEMEKANSALALLDS
eukprot:EC797421.1.p1 GENE.EC797421.1~~EC797421.1.p1  ORF type:complete len:201 (+),score=71.19 EC797421.1:7-609(+)